MELSEIRRMLAGVGLAGLMAGAVFVSGCATTGTSSWSSWGAKKGAGSTQTQEQQPKQPSGSSWGGSK